MLAHILIAYETRACLIVVSILSRVKVSEGIANKYLELNSCPLSMSMDKGIVTGIVAAILFVQHALQHHTYSHNKGGTTNKAILLSCCRPPPGIEISRELAKFQARSITSFLSQPERRG